MKLIAGVLYRSANAHDFRPILSANAKRFQPLSWILIPILSPSTVNEFSVHALLSFVNGIFQFCFRQFMENLDVERLFFNAAE